jgi:hypothetical protein
MDVSEENFFYIFSLLLESFWFLAWLIRPLRWGRLVPLKCRLTYSGLHGDISQKTGIFKRHAVFKKYWWEFRISMSCTETLNYAYTQSCRLINTTVLLRSPVVSNNGTCTTIQRRWRNKETLISSNVFLAILQGIIIIHGDYRYHFSNSYFICHIF